MNTKADAFEDVSFVHDEPISIPSFLSLFTKKLRPSFTHVVRLTSRGEYYNITKNGTKIKKLNKDSWDSVLHSRRALIFKSKICYFQMKIILLRNLNDEKDGGIFIGVSNSYPIASATWIGRSSVCAYNIDNTGLDQTVEHKIAYRAAGDVLGVVVDLERDVILFYKNTQLIAIGNKKPSAMRPMCAVVWLYYQNCEVEIGDYYPYKTLEHYAK